MPYLKKDAPPDVVEAIRQIEETADDCFASLAILGLHWNVAVWALLVGGVRFVEKEIATRGDNTLHLTATLLNVSRFIPVAIKWSRKFGKPNTNLIKRRWNTKLKEMVDGALFGAHHYSAFLTCLPMWHKDRYLAEVISPTLARYSAPGSTRDRQVSAYQKGFRPKEGRYKGHRADKVEQSPRVRQLFQQVFDMCRKAGALRFEYDDPWDLWRELLPEYEARMIAICRRSDSLSLGDYTLREFKQFYAALLAICAVHEFVCFSWGKNYGLYPLDSAVLVRSRSSWIAILSKLSGISSDKCRAVVKDLVFDFSRSLDLHIHPFVSLDSSGNTLSLAPQFPLHSSPDENILRVCSILRPAVFDLTSLEKQSELLSLIQTTSSRYSPQATISLPQPLPDIDLLLTDEASSTVVIAELKWIRKSSRPVEMIDRDADVLKGINQLQQIRSFLIENPDHLRALGKLPRSMSEYKDIHYVLVARDHWLWVEPSENMAIVEFEAFSAAVRRSESLQSAMSDVLKYEWLPIEGRDFTVRFDRNTANGVSVDSEVFYPA